MQQSGSQNNTSLIELNNIRKSYGGGESPKVEVLNGISLNIQAGEYVAIIGASGSGKSTLMNILGCLDRPSCGQYRLAGYDVAQLNNDQLAWLRREALGFVFQSYHLINTSTALENVEMPAIYTGTAATQRSQRANELLHQLGLADHCDNRPHQLSGGQQQRVSIARALINGGHVLLADEPTGALDSQSGKDVMNLFDQLAAAGHTIILITHDPTVAARADRIIEIHDGQIINDNGSNSPTCNQNHLELTDKLSTPGAYSAADEKTAFVGEFLDATRAAWRLLWRNRFRTVLTLLGIIIGVASVIVMLAVGEGSKREVIAELAAFGADIIYLSGDSATPGGPEGIITLDDIAALSTLPQIRKIMPVNGADQVIRFGNKDHFSYVRGNGVHFPDIMHWPVAEGSFFTAADERQAAAVAVIGTKVRHKLFGRESNPIGQYILIKNVPFQVLGVLSSKGSSGDWDSDNQIVIPYSTASIRLIGSYNPEFVIIAAKDTNRLEQTEEAIAALMYRLHNGVEDFELENSAAYIQAEANTRNILSILLGATAAISLLVGGIGVMNIMLMTVRERVREIGIRMATGARQRDILQQFLTEAAMLAIVGGLIGIGLSWLIGGLLVLQAIPVVYSLPVIVGAFACALITGLVFGFMPARKAAKLDPVVALTTS